MDDGNDVASLLSQMAQTRFSNLNDSSVTNDSFLLAISNFIGPLKCLHTLLFLARNPWLLMTLCSHTKVRKMHLKELRQNYFSLLCYILKIKNYRTRVSSNFVPNWHLKISSIPNFTHPRHHESFSWLLRDMVDGGQLAKHVQRDARAWSEHEVKRV